MLIVWGLQELFALDDVSRRNVPAFEHRWNLLLETNISVVKEDEGK